MIGNTLARVDKNLEKLTKAILTSTKESDRALPGLPLLRKPGQAFEPEAGHTPHVDGTRKAGYNLWGPRPWMGALLTQTVPRCGARCGVST